MALGDNKVIAEFYNHQGMYVVSFQFACKYLSGKEDIRVHHMFYGSKEAYEAEKAFCDRLDIQRDRKLFYN